MLIFDNEARKNAEKLGHMFFLEYNGFHAGVQVISGYFRDVYIGGLTDEGYEYFLFHGQTLAETEVAFHRLVDYIQESMPWDNV